MPSHIDFGCQEIEGSRTENSFSIPNLSIVIIAGPVWQEPSPYYCWPGELIDYSCSTDHRTDVWHLGCLRFGAATIATPATQRKWHISLRTSSFRCFSSSLLCALNVNCLFSTIIAPLFVFSMVYGTHYAYSPHTHTHEHSQRDQLLLPLCKPTERKFIYATIEISNPHAPNLI